MNSIDRRGFLKNSLLCASGTILATPLRAAPSRSQDQNAPPKPVVKRKLGKTGLELPVVSMGVMRSDNPGLVRAALKSGLVHLDTAHGYQKGKNEEMLGEVLKDFPRDSYVLATKIPPTDRESFLTKMDLSLQRLRMTYVDILYVHGLSSRGNVLDAEILETLKSLRTSGKVRHLGVSTHKNEPEVIQAAVESGVYEIVLTAVNFMQDHYPEVRKAIASATQAGVGIVGMKTMAGGFYDKERKKPINCKAALKWVLQDPNVATTIPGITSFDHLAENSSVNEDLTLTSEEKRDLLQGALQGGLYCNGCEECVGRCPRELPIPEMMRGYMYAYGYANAGMARELLSTMAVRSEPCSGCAVCTAECVKGFDVRSKIADVLRVRDLPEEFLSQGSFA
jgi:predicted aldo/keto reductase-like oxidoreductase